MKILFLSDNFPPEVNAPAVRTYEHCREWVKQGHEVTVITCAPNFPQGQVYPGYKNSMYSTEFIDGIEVIRVWSYIHKNDGLTLRVLDFISYALSAFFVGLFRNYDVLIATSPQIFTAISARILARIKCRPWVLEIRDLWPDQLHVKRGALWQLLNRQASKNYASADKVVVVTDGFRKKLLDKGIPDQKLVVVKNGINLERLAGFQFDSDLLRRKKKIQSKFIVGYLGTHGVAQNLKTVVNAARLTTNSEIVYVFVGDGAEREECIQYADELGLTNTIFLPQVDKDTALNYQSEFDVSVVPLRRDPVYLDVLPSKIFELAALGTPILLGVDGEAKNLVEEYRCGLSYEPDDSQQLAELVLQLHQNKDLLRSLTIGGHALAKKYNRSSLATEMLGCVEELVDD